MSLPDASPILSPGLRFGLEHATLWGLVICGILVVLSIFSWTVMLAKLWLLGRARRANARFLESFRGSNHPLAIFQLRERHDRSPLYHIYHAASRELAFYLLGTDDPSTTFSNRLQGAGRITPSQMSAVEAAMERAVSEAGLRLESKMSIVATALSGAPFLGLLGTVWGVMDSFSALAGAEDGAALQQMAPGVCAALLTTVVALLVAIPSVFGCNFLVSRIRTLVARLENFAGEYAGILDRHFVDHRQAEELPSLGALGAPNVPVFSGPAQPTQRPARSAATTMSEL